MMLQPLTLFAQRHNHAHPHKISLCLVEQIFLHTGLQFSWWEPFFFFFFSFFSTRCCSPRVGPYICGDMPACSRMVSSPPCCPLDVSRRWVAMCKTLQKNKSISTCLDYFSPHNPPPPFFLFLLSALTSTVGLSADFEASSVLQGLDAKQRRLACVFNSRLPRQLIEPWANLQTKITSRSGQTGSKEQANLFSDTSIFSVWSWAAVSLCFLFLKPRVELLILFTLLFYMLTCYPIYWAAHAILIKWEFSRWTPDIFLRALENRAVTCHGVPCGLLSVWESPVSPVPLPSGITFTSPDTLKLPENCQSPEVWPVTSNPCIEIHSPYVSSI